MTDIKIRNAFDDKGLVITDSFGISEINIPKEDVPELILAMQFWWMENKRLGNL